VASVPASCRRSSSGRRSFLILELQPRNKVRPICARRKPGSAHSTGKGRETKGIKQRSQMYSQGGLEGRWLCAWFGKHAQCRDWYRIFRSQLAFLLRSVSRPRRRCRPDPRETLCADLFRRVVGERPIGNGLLVQWPTVAPVRTFQLALCRTGSAHFTEDAQSAAGS